MENIIFDDADKMFYKNPRPGLIHIFRASNGIYYSYEAQDRWCCFSSENLIDWKYENNIRPEGLWGVMNFWVPEVIECNGYFYMYYCARLTKEEPSSRIGVAVSSSPTGPFKDIGKPMFDLWHVIDPHVFIDDDGKKYLYFSRDGAKNIIDGIHQSHIYGVEMNDDMISIKAEPKLLIKPDQEWEKKSLITNPGHQWNEAPTVVKENGTYYLLYSGNFFKTEYYAIGYAASKNPLGPFKKYENNPIISGEEWEGWHMKAGHSSFGYSPDGKEMFIIYTVTSENSTFKPGGRQLDRMGIRKDGTLYVNGPTRTEQPRPTGLPVSFVLPASLGLLSSPDLQGSSDSQESSDLQPSYTNIGPVAEVTVSSTNPQYSKSAINDGEIGIYKRLEKYEWVSDSEKAGAWVQMDWAEEKSVSSILIYDSAIEERKLKSGKLEFSNGDVIEVNDFPSEPGSAAIVCFVEKRIKWVKFTIDKLACPEGTAGLSEISVLSKNV